MASSRFLLLIEDDAAAEALALGALRKAGFGDRAVVAHDGIEALDYLAGLNHNVGEGQHLLPSAVVLDLNLPRIDGFEVLRRVRAELRTSLLPVIVFATSRRPEDVREAYRLGANSYVVKPETAPEFEAAISRIGRYWLTMNEPPQICARF